MTLAADHQLARLQNGLIRANMLRGQRYTSAKLSRDGEVDSIHFPAPGHYVFRYSLSSGAGDWKALQAYRAGANFNHPLIPISVVDDVSAKSLPPTNSFLSVQGDNLVLSALKKAEGSDPSIILRLYEIQGAQTDASFTFLGTDQPFRESNLMETESGKAGQRILHVEPYEIKTIKLRPAS